MGSVPLHVPLLPFPVCCFWLLQGPYTVRGKDGEAFWFSCRWCSSFRVLLANRQSVHSSKRLKASPSVGRLRGFH